MGRHLRTPLYRVHPSYSQDLPTGARPLSWAFTVGDLVYIWNFGPEARWLPGFITQLTGPYSYRVQLNNGQEWRHHIKQLRRRADDRAYPLPGRDGPTSPLHLPSGTVQTRANTSQPSQTEAFSSADLSDVPFPGPVPSLLPPGSMQSPVVPECKPSTPPAMLAAPVLRRSGRSRRHPAYLSDYNMRSGWEGVLSPQSYDFTPGSYVASRR